MWVRLLQMLSCWLVILVEDLVRAVVELCIIVACTLRFEHSSGDIVMSWLLVVLEFPLYAQAKGKQEKGLPREH